MSGALGMIAGSGDLPVDLAERCARDGMQYSVLRLRGITSPALEAHPGAEVALGKLGAALALLKRAGCDRLLFVGKVLRPRWRDISLDWTGFRGLLRVLMGWRHDDRLHRAISRLFEEQGIKVVGPADVWPDLLAPIGALTVRLPTGGDERTIAVAAAAALKLGLTDRGQGVVARDGAVLALEDRDHTDGLLRRVAEGRGEGGVLVKLAKPQQDRRLDLPVIGPETVAAAIEARLSGIAVEAGAAILARREKLVADADAAGLFIVGLDPVALR
ncbi:MAG: UDP-2,3-diacylglucosamine diphosphatase LpxI [Micropepsaceae bacterium]